MLKKLLKNKITILILFIISNLLIISIAVKINRNNLDKFKPNKNLIGNWSGSSKKFNSSNNNKNNFSPVELEFIIDEYGNIKGKVGNAKIVDCKLKKNRNSFEKFINIKTDYIICDGFIEGKINKNDIEEIKYISIPFNIENGILKGSLFKLEKWKYPYPIFTRIELIKSK